MEASLPPDSLFLGFDCSTQSLKATVLDANLKIFATEVVNFDTELPHYKTKGGVYRDPLINGRIVSPPLMWVEALDLVLDRLEKSKLDIERIVAVSGSAQQHGSVYWKNGSSMVLASLDSKLTGSCTHERYAGPQIRRIHETQLELYESTERISLIRSFIGSLLIGGYACIDQTDGAGMCLMDIKLKAWSKIALEATAPDLEKRLGNLAATHAISGFMCNYFVERYHFRRNCLVVQWSGDNRNSLAGLTLNAPGDLAISLGTSDTVFGIATEHRPSLEGHVFPDPVNAEHFMVMLVYKNGSLTREDFRDRFAKSSWELFDTYLQQTPPLNGGKIGFYYKEHEILPPLPIGEHRYVLENLDDSLTEPMEVRATEFDAPFEVRALIEGQLLSMRAHAEKIGMPSPPRRIIATGGASSNKCILNLIASIFGCDVYTVQRPDSASLGAALRAAHGWLCHKKGTLVPIECMYLDKLQHTSLNCKLSAKAGDRELVARYTLLMNRRAEIENELVQKFGRI